MLNRGNRPKGKIVAGIVFKNVWCQHLSSKKKKKKNVDRKRYDSGAANGILNGHCRMQFKPDFSGVDGLRGLLVAVGRCNTQVRLSLIYVSGNLLDLRYLGSLWGRSYVRSHISKMHV